MPTIIRKDLSLDNKTGKLFTVHKGKSYKAEIQLTWFEARFATEELIREQFTKLGFVNVKVSGSGDKRIVRGKWNHEDETVPLSDRHIVSVVEIA
jgi:hypothetical protein